MNIKKMVVAYDGRRKVRRRGMGGFKNLVIGSVAQKVVTYSKVPVTIMK